MKKMNKKSLALNALLNGLQSILNLLFPLITFPYVSRVLSVDGMGIYNFSYTYVNYFVLIAGLGVSTYAIREGAKYRDDSAKMSDFASQVFSINIISTLVAYVILLLSLVIFPTLRNYFTCILVFSLQIFFTTIGANWLYVIYEDYAYITTRNILFKIASILLLFIFVKRPSDYLIYAWITVLAAVGSNVLNFIHAQAFIKLGFRWQMNWRTHLKPTLIIFASAVAVNIYMSSDTTILGLIKGDYAVGIYGVSVKIYTIAASFLTAILTVTIPRLSALYGKKKFSEYRKLLNKLINLLLVLAFPAMTGLMMESKYIVRIIAGEKYIQSATSLSIIAWAILFSVFSWIFSDCVLLPAKREKYLLKNTIITAIFNVLINLIFIPLWSYDGAAMGTVLAEILSVSLNAYYGKDILTMVISKWEILHNIIDAVVGCLVIVGICYLINQWINSYIFTLIFAVLTAVLGYMLTLIILKNPSLKEFWHLSRSIIKKGRSL